MAKGPGQGSVLTRIDAWDFYARGSHISEEEQVRVEECFLVGFHRDWNEAYGLLRLHLSSSSD